MMTFGNRYLVQQESKHTQSCRTYICEDINTNKSVFVKVLNVSDDRKTVVKELFKREVRALEMLHHPGIIEYLDAGVDRADNPYIVVEYFRSQNIYDFLNNEAIDLEGKFNIAINIVNALIHSHDKNVIHRDIKPQNILINIDYDIRIVDFGISKIIGMAYNPSETLKDFMSARYAAPEQLQRQEVTKLSDLYSYGLLLAFLFSGEEPPIERKDLDIYIGKIEIPGIARIIKELTNVDTALRIQSGHKAKAVLLKERANYVNATQKVNVRCSPNAIRKLRDVGMIRNTNTKEATSFIAQDIGTEYFGYKKRDVYCFIGNRVKYSCKFPNERTFFNITDITVADDQNFYEKEQRSGMPLFASWNFVSDGSIIPNHEETERMANDLSDFEIQKAQDYKEKELDNKLISNWNKLLKEEYLLLNEKKDVGKYVDFRLDSTGERLSISVKQCHYPIQLGESLQLTVKENNQQKTIGQFIKIIDDNTLLASLNQDTDLDEFSASGTLSIDIVQEKANLRRFSLALNQVKNCNSANPRILSIINNPSSVSMNPIVPIDRFFQDVFSDQFSPNAIAVKKALSTKDMFLLQGPPGTGKTTVISEIICQILCANLSAKILLVSQSHVAVDHAIKKVSELLPDTCIVRIGRTDKISKSSEGLLYANKLSEWVATTKEKSTTGLISYLSRKYDNIDADKIKAYINTFDLQNNMSTGIVDSDTDSCGMEIAKVISLIGRWQRHLGKLDEFDEIFADTASIVAATCVGIASRNKVSNLTYDWVIIDEAARATPLETLIPMVKGKKVVMVGDHKQLPPIFKTKVLLSEKSLKQSDLEKSLFEDMFSRISNPAQFVLTEQFRMHPAISDMISEAFYPGENLTTKLKPADRKHHLRWKDKAIVWIDTAGYENHKEKEVAFSKSNSCEVSIISSLLQDIKNSYNAINTNISIGVISGYDAQKNLLYDSIRPQNTAKWGQLDIAIDNVDAYQGSEVDIVIYSVVRSNEHGQLGFLSDIRRLNVALSRGRSCLIIVGDYRFIQKANLDGFNPFVPVLRYIENHKNYAIREVSNI